MRSKKFRKNRRGSRRRLGGQDKPVLNRQNTQELIDMEEGLSSIPVAMPQQKERPKKTELTLEQLRKRELRRTLDKAYRNPPPDYNLINQHDFARNQDRAEFSERMKNEMLIKKKRGEEDERLREIGEDKIDAPYGRTVRVANQEFRPIPKFNVKDRGIGLLGKGVESDWDTFDTAFNGGVKNKKNKSKRRSNKSNKTNRKSNRKNKTNKKHKRSRKN